MFSFTCIIPPSSTNFSTNYFKTETSRQQATISRDGEAAGKGGHKKTTLSRHHPKKSVSPLRRARMFPLSTVWIVTVLTICSYDCYYLVCRADRISAGTTRHVGILVDSFPPPSCHPQARRSEFCRVFPDSWRDWHAFWSRRRPASHRDQTWFYDTSRHSTILVDIWRHFSALRDTRWHLAVLDGASRHSATLGDTWRHLQAIDCNVKTITVQWVAWAHRWAHAFENLRPFAGWVSGWSGWRYSALCELNVVMNLLEIFQFENLNGARDNKTRARIYTFVPRLLTLHETTRLVLEFMLLFRDY